MAALRLHPPISVSVVLLLGLAMAVLSAASAGIPFIIKLVVDLVTNLKVGNQLDAHGALKLREYSLLLAGLFLLRAIANFGDDYLSSYITQKMVVDIRGDLNESLQRQSLSFFNRTPTGVMVSRIISDAGLVVSSLSNGVFSIFGDGMSLIALLVAAFWLDWRIRDYRLHRFPNHRSADRKPFEESSPRNQESAKAIERPAVAAA